MIPTSPSAFQPSLNMVAVSPDELKKIYSRRFGDTAAYRARVWRLLCREFFSHHVPSDGTVLDLGCGYGEFINQISARRKFAMDLNPESRARLAADVTLFEQDCSTPWSVPAGSIDCIFTSNFFEHLPNKTCLNQTFTQAIQALRPGGLLIAMGPNIKYVPGSYWDYYDHHVALTETSLSEALEVAGFAVERAIPRFLPYTLVRTRAVPDFLIRTYLRVPLLWRLKGQQFLVFARKPLPAPNVHV